MFNCLRNCAQENAQDLQRLLDKHATPKNAGFGKFIGSAATAKEIITYAHKLCYTTFAPPGYEAGVTVLHNFRPPMPQEWQLRASQLHASSGERSCLAVRLLCVTGCLLHLHAGWSPNRKPKRPVLAMQKDCWPTNVTFALLSDRKA